jgi:hypothetical protein
MKRTSLMGIVVTVLATVLAMVLAACNNPAGGGGGPYTPTTTTETYNIVGFDDANNLLDIEIYGTRTRSVRALQPASNDKYKVSCNNVVINEGTISVSGNSYQFKSENDPNVTQFTITPSRDTATITGDIKVEKGVGSGLQVGEEVSSPTLAPVKTEGLTKLNGKWALQGASDHGLSSYIYEFSGTTYTLTSTPTQGTATTENGVVSYAVLSGGYYLLSLTETASGSKEFMKIKFDNAPSFGVFDMTDGQHTLQFNKQS